MIVKTWIPQKRKQARTLADVPSSREKPVLCWFADGEKASPMFADESGTWRVRRNGSLCRVDNDPEDLLLYDQPIVPKTLDEVPERWIVFTNAEDEVCRLWFRLNDSWRMKYAEHDNDEFTEVGCGPPSNWRLTDCEAVLHEIDVEVMG